MSTTETHLELPPVVSREAWLAARKAFLEKEKELTRTIDRVNADRRRLPMVEIDQSYVFEGPHGRATLLDVFEGRLQLVVYHFMWRWSGGEPLDLPCPGCAGWADQIARGHLASLQGRGTTLAFITRAPMAKVMPFKARMGWRLPFYSSYGSDFNFDFHVSFDAAVAPLEYNYRTPEEHARAGTSGYLEGEQPFDLHGISCFLRDGAKVYHTYSTYGRGTEAAGGANHLIDLTALGRQEPWEEPKGRLTGLGAAAGTGPIRYPDEYTY